jgi:hypothetical protein
VEQTTSCKTSWAVTAAEVAVCMRLLLCPASVVERHVVHCGIPAAAEQIDGARISICKAAPPTAAVLL